MNAIANVAIDESQFPENIRRDLLRSLRSRKINHKFHYDSVKQTQKWLALHQIYSPSRHDKNVRDIYQGAFETAALKIKSPHVQVLGLGCGGGQKDTRLLKSLKSRGKKVFYTPCDVSTAMVLVARKTALSVVPAQNCSPTVCDLTTAGDLRNIFNRRHPTLVTFFGMIPNFEPDDILPKLASLIGRKDYLLFSANLAPGKDYAVGMKTILPQYDNKPTREWLMTFLLDLGIETGDGDLRFSIEKGDAGLKRVVANFFFQRGRQIAIEDQTFRFKAGEKIRLFFSYRYTPALVSKHLAKYRLEVCDHWIADSEEEGVFLCRQKSA